MQAAVIPQSCAFWGIKWPRPVAHVRRRKHTPDYCSRVAGNPASTLQGPPLALSFPSGELPCFPSLAFARGPPRSCVLTKPRKRALLDEASLCVMSPLQLRHGTNIVPCRHTVKSPTAGPEAVQRDLGSGSTRKWPSNLRSQPASVPISSYTCSRTHGRCNQPTLPSTNSLRPSPAWAYGH